MSAPAAFQPAEWASAELLYQGRTTRLSRRDALNLVNRVMTLTAANASPSANADGNSDSTANPDRSASAVPKATRDAGTLRLRLQLLNQGNPAAVAQFELRGGNNFRWQRAGEPDVWGRLTAEAVASLLAEAARTLTQ